MRTREERLDDLKHSLCRLRGLPPYPNGPYKGDIEYSKWIIREFKPDEIEEALDALNLLGPEGIPLDLRSPQADPEAPTINHSERAHAKLSASGSKRWLTCPPSAGLEDEVDDEESEFSKEGTAAHEYSEILLRIELGGNDGADIAEADEFQKRNEYFNAEMADYCGEYVNLVMERYHAALAIDPHAQLIIEERLDYSRWVPDGFGTGDVLILCWKYIEVIDLKYGKGVKVIAVDNSQTRLYGLGALDGYDALYDFEEVRMTIVQPRLDHIDTEVLPVSELMTWADDYVRPRALQADAGEGEFCAGDHCGFCKVRNTCRARAEYVLELEKFELKKPPLLSLEEIGEILVKADDLQKWAKGVQDYALDQAERHGVKIPGWKLVEGKANRKITDEEAVATIMELEGYDDDQIYNKKMKGIGDLEKILGVKGFNAMLGDYIVKPPGKPALVPESDRRPEINSADQAEQDFAD